MEYHWLDRFEYPFRSHYFEIDGHHLHYVDEGQGAPVLFVHGTPSWSFDFRKLIKVLRQNHRCIAVDHIGFGLSDKPECFDYSIQNHCKTLEEFILKKNLHAVTLVVHDFGGPIGLNFAIRFPERIERLVILNSWLWSSRSDPGFVRLAKVLKSPLVPFLYRYFNFSPRYILPGSFGDRKLPKYLLKQYTAPFADRNQRNGPVAFARSLTKDQDWMEGLWKKISIIEDKPALFIWGMKDFFFGPDSLTRFQTGFKKVDTIQLATCGHFPQEEEPETVARCIHDFLLGV
jgi:pimeloyl-ACP methyl ester carboxylesterase